MPCGPIGSPVVSLKVHQIKPIRQDISEKKKKDTSHHQVSMYSYTQFMITPPQRGISMADAIVLFFWGFILMIHPQVSQQHLPLMLRGLKTSRMLQR